MDHPALASLASTSDVLLSKTTAAAGGAQTPPALPGERLQQRVEPIALNSGAAPQAKGKELEEAALRLFQTFFKLTEEVEEGIRIQSEKLRNQRSGEQFGYDLSFEGVVAGLNQVRCHVECKNYQREVETRMDSLNSMASCLR